MKKTLSWSHSVLVLSLCCLSYIGVSWKFASIYNQVISSIITSPPHYISKNMAIGQEGNASHVQEVHAAPSRGRRGWCRSGSVGTEIQKVACSSGLCRLCGLGLSSVFSQNIFNRKNISNIFKQSCAGSFCGGPAFDEKPFSWHLRMFLRQQMVASCRQAACWSLIRFISWRKIGLNWSRNRGMLRVYQSSLYSWHIAKSLAQTQHEVSWMLQLPHLL